MMAAMTLLGAVALVLVPLHSESAGAPPWAYMLHSIYSLGFETLATLAVLV